LNSIANSALKPLKVKNKSKALLPKPKNREFRGDFSSEEEKEEKNDENRSKIEKNCEKNSTKIEEKKEKMAAEPPKVPLAEGLGVAAPDLPNPLKSQIYLAVKNGDAEIFEEILRNFSTDFQIGLDFYLNEQIGQDQLTLLHIASKAGHASIIRTLLKVGCNPTIRSKSGEVPFQLAANKSTRREFIEFRVQNPEKWNWNCAQIPNPSAPDPEAEARKAEKRRQAKKARNERLKEEKTQKRAEEFAQKERDRYLALSDREKRALAAERRILSNCQQDGNKTAATPVLQRCFECAADMTGQVPFEYSDNRFCSMRCLKLHREKNRQIN